MYGFIFHLLKRGTSNNLKVYSSNVETVCPIPLLPLLLFPFKLPKEISTFASFKGYQLSFPIIF